VINFSAFRGNVSSVIGRSPFHHWSIRIVTSTVATGRRCHDEVWVNRPFYALEGRSVCHQCKRSHGAYSNAKQCCKA